MPLTIEQLTGYVERDLDVDLARWFPDGPRVGVPASTRSVEPFLARPPHAAAIALAGFDGRVRSGALPARLDMADWSYAFDFGANDCRILDSDYETELSDDDVWSIGADGGGNYHAVRAGVLELADVEGDFRALGQPGVLQPGVGLLASLA